MNSNSPSLLVLDDDEVFIGLLKRIVKHDDCTVQGFSDQLQCLDYLSHTEPSHLVVDYRMPKINGIQFLAMLKSQGFSGKTKILLISAIALPEEVQAELSSMGGQMATKDELLDKVWLRTALGLSDPIE
jgi:two-component system, chemotaxis family, chemotaxis protein CheY